MDISIGSSLFVNVQIPVLWGSRAILQDNDGRLSVIDLTGPEAKLEILADDPAPDIDFSPTIDGFNILEGGEPLYTYSRSEKTLMSKSLSLPSCQIKPSVIRIGTNVFSKNVIVGSPVGIAVTPNGISVGSPLPPNLAKLVV